MGKKCLWRHKAAATVQQIQAAPESTADNANTGGLQKPHSLLSHFMVSDELVQVSLLLILFYVSVKLVFCLDFPLIENYY